jgi:hypothetical protein
MQDEQQEGWIRGLHHEHPGPTQTSPDLLLTLEKSLLVLVTGFYYAMLDNPPD